MYIFRQSVIEICKTFLSSIAISIVFAFMIYRKTALPNAFVCLVLNGAAFMLFLYAFYLNLSKLDNNSFSTSEYFIPALVSVVMYTVVTAYFYMKRFMFYMWFFLPTRFLEPWLNKDFAYLSTVVVYVSMLIVVIITPVLNRRKLWTAIVDFL